MSEIKKSGVVVTDDKKECSDCSTTISEGFINASDESEVYCRECMENKLSSGEVDVEYSQRAKIVWNVDAKCPSCEVVVQKDDDWVLDKKYDVLAHRDCLINELVEGALKSAGEMKNFISSIIEQKGS